MNNSSEHLDSYENDKDYNLRETCFDIVNCLAIPKESHGHLIVTNQFLNRLKPCYLYGKSKCQFEWESIIDKIKSDSSNDSTNNIASILDCFDDKWKWHFIMSLSIEVCKKRIKSVSKNFNAVEFSTLWKKIVLGFSCIIDTFCYQMALPQIPMTSNIQLCLKQMKTKLSFFNAAIDYKSTVVLDYTKQCLLSCLDQLRMEIINNREIPCYEFINLMDSAINHLDTLVEETTFSSVINLDDLKYLIDELLCRSITTAHVAIDVESKEGILSKSQVILKDLKALTEAITDNKTELVSWAARSLGDDLCGLERLVNLAVLKLVLHMEANMNNPIKILIKTCEPKSTSSEAVANRKATDLNDLIGNLDTYLDRIMQIGSFAVSCSSSLKKAVELKSCLASFESLEAELVACATAMYLNPTKEHKQDLRFIVNHWLDESSKFHEVLDTIIDPTAFIDVVRDFLVDCTKKLQSDWNKNDCLLSMVKAARTLDGIVRVCMKFENISDLPQIYEKVNQALLKCESLCRRFPLNDIKTQMKVMRSASRLVASVETLLTHQTFKVLETQSQLQDATYKGASGLDFTPKKSYYKLCVSDVELSSECVEALAGYMAKGECNTKKSVLYNTPKRSTIKDVKTPKSLLQSGKCSTIARNRHRFSVQRKQNDEKELSDMELTLLLEGLKCTDDTFSSDMTLFPPKEFQCRNLLDLLNDWTLSENNGTSHSTTNLTPDSNHVDTLERMQDLRQLEDKINHLKN